MLNAFPAFNQSNNNILIGLRKQNQRCGDRINFIFRENIYLFFFLITLLIQFTNSTSSLAFATLKIDINPDTYSNNFHHHPFRANLPTLISSTVSASKATLVEDTKFIIHPWQTIQTMTKISESSKTPRNFFIRKNSALRKRTQLENSKEKNDIFNARGGASDKSDGTSLSVPQNNDNLQKGFPSFMETYDGYRVHGLKWDEEKEKFSLIDQQIGSKVEFIDDQCKRVTSFLKQCFLAENVTPDYFNYTKWRVLQRLVSATVSVFGTRALLLALGVKTEKVGVAATFNWIQKDAFGKFARIMWASKMGRKFDSDAKRWRFRSSLLYASATGLEILTYVFPSFFLLLATSANTLKQISMLTSSATRNSMYKSFAGESQNLGDITAKGEAQIAVVDLLGILLGIFLSKTMGTSTFTMAFAYIILSLIDIFAIYNEVRSVVFNYPNLERSILIIEEFIGVNKETSPQTNKKSLPLLNIPTPNEISKREKIFFPPDKIDRSIFKTLSQTGVGIKDIEKLIPIFKDENYLITWKTNTSLINRDRPSICLNPRATDRDIHKALLCVEYIMQMHSQDATKDSFQIIKEAQDKCKRNYDLLQKLMIEKGWNIKHFSFGRILVRTDW